MSCLRFGQRAKTVKSSSVDVEFVTSHRCISTKFVKGSCFLHSTLHSASSGTPSRSHSESSSLLKLWTAVNANLLINGQQLKKISAPAWNCRSGSQTIIRSNIVRRESPATAFPSSRHPRRSIFASRHDSRYSSRGLREMSQLSSAMSSRSSRKCGSW